MDSVQNRVFIWPSSIKTKISELLVSLWTPSSLHWTLYNVILVIITRQKGTADFAPGPVLPLVSHFKLTAYLRCFCLAKRDVIRQPEVHNGTRNADGKSIITKITCLQNLVTFGHVVSDICQRTATETDTLIATLRASTGDDWRPSCTKLCLECRWKISIIIDEFLW